VIPRGDTGAEGPKGDPGTSLAISGTITTTTPGASGGPPLTSPAGSMYILSDPGNALNGHGFVSDGANPSVYTDVGQIQGPEGPQGPAGPVGGADTQILFNDNGACSGASDLTFASNTLTTNKITTTGDITAGTGAKFVGDGSGITNLNFAGTLSFEGSTDVTGTPPSATAGDYYVNDTAGFADNAWTGIAGNLIALNQLLYYTKKNTWVAGANQD
jgi:hypothetical protein